MKKKKMMMMVAVVVVTMMIIFAIPYYMPDGHTFSPDQFRFPTRTMSKTLLLVTGVLEKYGSVC